MVGKPAKERKDNVNQKLQIKVRCRGRPPLRNIHLDKQLTCLEAIAFVEKNHFEQENIIMEWVTTNKQIVDMVRKKKYIIEEKDIGMPPRNDF